MQALFVLVQKIQGTASHRPSETEEAGVPGWTAAFLTGANKRLRTIKQAGEAEKDSSQPRGTVIS